MVLCCCHEKALRGNAPDGSDFKCVPKKPSRYTPERAFIYPSPCTGSAVRRTEKAFSSSRFRSLSQLVIPRQPGKYRIRIASGPFYLSMNHLAGFYLVPQDHQHTLPLDGEFIFGACPSIVYRASLISEMKYSSVRSVQQTQFAF